MNPARAQSCADEGPAKDHQGSGGPEAAIKRRWRTVKAKLDAMDVLRLDLAQKDMGCRHRADVVRLAVRAWLKEKGY